MGLERMVSLINHFCRAHYSQHICLHRVPDLALPMQHPKRSFIQRAVEYEIRLSYHDRILKTLPEAMHGPDVYIISEQAPGPDFEYDDPCMCSSTICRGVVHLKRCYRQPLS
jgi:nuclear cap-binding protein subunit 1